MKRFTFLGSIFFTLIFNSSFSQQTAPKPKESIVLICREVGFFSVFMDVINTLEAYDAGLINGVSIQFRKFGLYYDPTVGENWWNYYFEPVLLGEIKVPFRVSSGLGEYYIHKDYPYLKHQEIIQKYVHLLPSLKNELETFIEENFTNHYMIGVHYRGTDKITESGRVSYEWMLNTIHNQIQRTPDNWKIFLATDEEKFVKALEEKYPNRICYINAQRAKDEFTPVHTDSRNSPYNCGKEALMDCIILSRTDLLIRTSSNLSECCKYFSPNQEIVFVTGI